MKKILLTFPLLFVFLFSLCGNRAFSHAQNVDNFSTAILFSIEAEKSGKYTQTISFPTMEEDLALEEKTNQEYVQELLTKIKTTLFFSYFFNYYNISSTIQKTDYKFGGEKANYVLPTYKEEEKTISFSFSFFDDEAYKLYHPQKEDKKESESESGFFFNKQKSTGKFLFAQNLKGEEKTVGEYFVEILSTTIEKFSNEKIENPIFVYCYKHFSNKIRSNADIVKEEKDGVLHIWKSDLNALSQDKIVEVFVISPNRGNWYLLALGGAILTVGIAGLIHYFINRAKKEEKLEEEK